MSDYTPSGNPATSASGSSSDIRTEFGLIQTAVNSKANATGSASFATVGTVTSGTWNATVIGVAYGGTGRTTSTTAYGLLAAGTTATGAHQTLAAGATTEMLVGGGTSALPVWTAATGTGAPVRAESPTLVTPKSSTTIGVGNADAAASGAGVTFPATQSASTDANTLDDYEEGTFTPVVEGTSAAGSGTYTLQSGEYTKIGNLVTIRLSLSWSAHTGSGNIQIAGLPFTSGSAGITPCAINQSSMSYTSGYSIYAYISASATTIAIVGVPSGGGAPSSISLDTSASFFVSATYHV